MSRIAARFAEHGPCMIESFDWWEAYRTMDQDPISKQGKPQ